MNMENKEKSMWSMQELDEKSRWAFEHPHDAKERRKIRTDIADEIEEMLMNPNLLEDALAEICVLEQEDTE